MVQEKAYLEKHLFVTSKLNVRIVSFQYAEQKMVLGYPMQ